MNDEPIYKLIINPKYASNHTDTTPNSSDLRLMESIAKQIEKYETILNALGKARDWNGNPRFDLAIEAGLDALLKESKNK